MYYQFLGKLWITSTFVTTASWSFLAVSTLYYHILAKLKVACWLYMENNCCTRAIFHLWNIDSIEIVKLINTWNAFTFKLLVMKAWNLIIYHASKITRRWLTTVPFRFSGFPPVNQSCNCYYRYWLTGWKMKKKWEENIKEKERKAQEKKKTK